MSNPTPESVREALEHTYHSAWYSETFQREGMNAQRKYQADEILRALWEERHSESCDCFACHQAVENAMRCASVLYGKDGE